MSSKSVRFKVFRSYLNLGISLSNDFAGFLTGSISVTVVLNSHLVYCAVWGVHVPSDATVA